MPDESPAETQPLKNVAVILAGGVGTRIGLGIPKQLIKIAGRTILEHTIGIFDAHPEVDEIIVMMASGHLDSATAIVRDGGFRKVVDVLEGAETRSQTTMRALARLGDEECNVLLHDAVRPAHRLRSRQRRYHPAGGFLRARRPRCGRGRLRGRL